jgi:two-component system chemotaxis response regulator CheY
MTSGTMIGSGGLRVLIVDDNFNIRQILAALVEVEGGTVFEAESGAEAISRYRAHKPNLVLLDVDMPGMSGLEAARAIKRMNPDAAIVMVTGRAERQVVAEAYAIGIQDFLVKAFDPLRVRQLLQQHRLRLAA